MCFAGMQIPFQYPFCTITAIHKGLRSQYLLVYKMSIRDYEHGASNGTVYNKSKLGCFAFNAYQILQFCCFHLSICMFCTCVTICASVQLGWHSHLNKNKFTDGRASARSTQIAAFNFIINYYSYSIK